MGRRTKQHRNVKVIQIIIDNVCLDYVLNSDGCLPKYMSKGMANSVRDHFRAEKKAQKQKISEQEKCAKIFSTNDHSFWSDSNDTSQAFYEDFF